MSGQLQHRNRTLLYAVKCPIQNCQILALMYGRFVGCFVRILIRPTLLQKVWELESPATQDRRPGRRHCGMIPNKVTNKYIHLILPEPRARPEPN